MNNEFEIQTDQSTRESRLSTSHHQMEEEGVEVEASVVPSELLSSSDSKGFASWFRSLDQVVILILINGFRALKPVSRCRGKE